MQQAIDARLCHCFVVIRYHCNLSHGLNYLVVISVLLLGLE